MFATSRIEIRYGINSYTINEFIMMLNSFNAYKERKALFNSSKTYRVQVNPDGKYVETLLNFSHAQSAVIMMKPENMRTILTHYSMDFEDETWLAMIIDNTKPKPGKQPKTVGGKAKGKGKGIKPRTQGN